MAESIDCTHGVGEDLGYVLLGQKPPRYTDEEWEKRLNIARTSKDREENTKIIEAVFSEMCLLSSPKEKRLPCSNLVNNPQP